MQQHQKQQHQKQHRQHGLNRDSFSPPSTPETFAFSASPIVDIEAIELEKENIQPLRQGRSAQTLARLFATQHEDRAQEQAVMHGRFQAELANIDDLDDPMDVYSRYVKWMIENYPQSAGQGHDSQLTPVLERALMDFKDDQRYRNDPRFVKLLVMYSEKITNPVELFNFMEANGIGSEISMYYEEFADFLESREEFDRAREIFVTGINRRARPLGRLKKQYEDFERRAQIFKDEIELEAAESARALSAQQQQQQQQQHQHHQQRQPHSSAPNLGAGATRQVLGVKVSKSESVHSNASTQGHVPIGAVRSSLSSTSSGSRGTGSSGQSRPGAKLQVYSDQDAQPSAPTKSKTSSRNPPSQSSTPWKDFGAEQVRRKENIREATSWKGATLSSEDTLPMRPYPKLEVYRDPESPPKDTAQPTTTTPSDENKQTVPLAPAQQQHILQPQHIPTERTILDGLQYHTSHESTLRIRPESTPHGRQRFPVTTNANGKPECLMIDLNEIYVDEEEFSVEEIRARRHRYSWRRKDKYTSTSSRQSSSPPSPPQPPSAGSSSKHYRDDSEPGPAPGKHPQKKTHTENPQDPPTTPSRSPAPSASVGELFTRSVSDDERQYFRSKRRLTASPTLNTKYASAEMNKIFSDRSRTRRSMDSQWSAEDSQDVGEDELDNFTMAYSIPSLPLNLPTFSREFLDSDAANEFEDDDDDQEGRTEGFIRSLENGYSSTITQDIAALKRRRAEEMALADNTQSSQRNRLSLRESMRLSSRFDPFKTQESDITIDIRQRTQQLQQEQQRSVEGIRDFLGSSTYGYSRSSLGRASIGSSALTRSRFGSEEPSRTAVERTSQGQESSPTVFKDGAGSLDIGMTVPMLEDEAPPALLDEDEVI
ncbi:hypothetical protein BGX33_010248 [Mortierella sp. NVP41]|nr:hypothetical protein BGX33_010248 [Mortierella sp. NVP41]